MKLLSTMGNILKTLTTCSSEDLEEKGLGDALRKTENLISHKEEITLVSNSN